MARPRVKFQLWTLFIRRLASRDRLQRFGLNIELSCVFCTELESIDHLFFNCRSTQEVWNKILMWIGYTHVGQEWNIEKNWIVQELRKRGWKRQLLKIALAETTYSLWKARNEIIFNNIPMAQDIATRIKYIFVICSRLHRAIKEHICLEILSIH
ncbi:uncharacterized protein LOC131633123 [Vicia villosa]|uniref:uncharacterized protein LOC131633123 n=1 Tax=Vicia villosa TaxID=3911 RepID=UPI00273AB9D1|nr:uncharacterized protein LOC131633123 [Vicia villosa]